jgi:hypothetical protein
MTIHNKKLANPLLDRYLKELADTAYAASQNYDIWWIYKEERPKYVGVMREYSGFFISSIHAHFVAMLMALSKLYEDNKHSINIKKFIKLIEIENLISDNVIIEIRNSLNGKKNLIEKISILRNNYFAHINEKLDYDKVLKKANIKYKNFKELINLSNDILCKIPKSHMHLGNRSEKDTHRLLDALLQIAHKKLYA